MRKFNVTGLCTPDEDYMVDISDKIEQIKRLVDRRSYFVINRARQYGKTTTLRELQKALADEYIVCSLSFQGMGDECFSSDASFCQSFVNQVARALQFTSTQANYIEDWNDGSITNFGQLSQHITKMCEKVKLVLLIDEVDRTSNNRVFIHFIDMLRDKFLARKAKEDYTFHSVILAGVYDVKNIKLKMINEGVHTPTVTEGKLYNSPWNIAVNFNVDMSFNPAEISTMLSSYEEDYKTGMNIAAIAEEIHSYTNGYPFLVSRISQCVDEELDADWSHGGVQRAVKILLEEKNTLFDDIFKNLENNKALYDFIYDLLILGSSKSFTISNPIIGLGHMYGFFEKRDGKVAIANKIFEILMTEHFISKDESMVKSSRIGVLQYDVVKDGKFDMELCLRKFANHYGEIFNDNDAEFLERHGRLLFLSYLKPLINGHGFYHIESQFTDLRRMDIVVDFGSQQFIIELKRWRGEQYQAEAYSQLCNYLESKHMDTGYLLTFDFRKDGNKVRKAEWIEVNGKRIFDVMV